MKDNWKTVEFKGSFTDRSQCPVNGQLEVAMIGRSNVGKSSLINALLNKKGIAKISGTPGKTQTLNYYHIEERFYIVDLPGYGYARVSKKLRSQFKSLIASYLNKREVLICTFILLDIRVKPMDSDMDFINDLASRGVPLVLVYTKSDKLKPEEVDASLELYHKRLLETWNDLPMEFITSAKSKDGIEELRTFIEDTIEQISDEW